jgi:hypothetical protein
MGRRHLCHQEPLNTGPCTAAPASSPNAAGDKSRTLGAVAQHEHLLLS